METIGAAERKNSEKIQYNYEGGGGGGGYGGETGAQAGGALAKISYKSNPPQKGVFLT